jgi:hypothetical protein
MTEAETQSQARADEFLLVVDPHLRNLLAHIHYGDGADKYFLTVVHEVRKLTIKQLRGAFIGEPRPITSTLLFTGREKMGTCGMRHHLEIYNYPYKMPEFHEFRSLSVYRILWSCWILKRAEQRKEFFGYSLPSLVSPFLVDTCLRV